MTSQDLCRSCGLCCDGTLFGYVRVAETDDPSQLAAMGLVVDDGPSGLRFAQPCPAFAGDCCQVYDQRPGKCRLFRCRLLKNVEAGRANLDEATDVVKRARLLRDQVVAAFRDAAAIEPTAPPLALSTIIARTPSVADIQQDPSLGSRWAKVVLPLKVLRELLARRFEKER
jgi:hypothetical protein